MGLSLRVLRSVSILTLSERLVSVMNLMPLLCNVCSFLRVVIPDLNSGVTGYSSMGLMRA